MASIVGFGHPSNIFVNGINCRGRQILDGGCNLALNSIEANSLVLTGIAETVGPTLQISSGFAQFDGDVVINGEFEYESANAEVGDALLWSGTKWTPGRVEGTFEIVDTDGFVMDPEIRNAFVFPDEGEGTPIPIVVPAQTNWRTQSSAFNSAGELFVLYQAQFGDATIYNYDGTSADFDVFNPATIFTRGHVVVKYDSTGNALCYTTIASSANHIGQSGALAIDSNDCLWVAVHNAVGEISNFRSTTDAGTIAIDLGLVGRPYLLKYDGSGVYQAGAIMDNNSPQTYDSVRDVFVDSTDAVWVSRGVRRSSSSSANVYNVEADPTSATPVAGKAIDWAVVASPNINRCILQKWDSAGLAESYTIVESNSSNGKVSGKAIVEDSNGDIYWVARGFYGNFRDMTTGTTLGSAEVTLSPSFFGDRSWLIKFSGGLVQWVAPMVFPTNSRDFRGTLLIDTNDNIYYLGGYLGSTSGTPSEFTTYDATSRGGSSFTTKFPLPYNFDGVRGLVLKYSTSGTNLEWLYFDGGVDSIAEGMSVFHSGAIGPSNDLVVAATVGETSFAMPTFYDFTTNMARSPGTPALNPTTDGGGIYFLRYDLSTGGFLQWSFLSGDAETSTFVDQAETFTSPDFMTIDPVTSNLIVGVRRLSLESRASGVHNFTSSATLPDATYKIIGSTSTVSSLLRFDAYEVVPIGGSAVEMDITLPVATTTPAIKSIWFVQPFSRYILTVNNSDGSCVFRFQGSSDTRADNIEFVWNGTRWALARQEIWSDIESLLCYTA